MKLPDDKAAYDIAHKLTCRDWPENVPEVTDADSLLAALVVISDAQGRYFAAPHNYLRLFDMDDFHINKEAILLRFYKWRDQLAARGDIILSPLAKDCYGGSWYLCLTIQNKHRFQRWAQRPPIPKALRASVYERDGHACVTCGSTNSLSLDHIIPWSKNGQDTYENFQTLCRPCNSRKGNREVSVV